MEKRERGVERRRGDGKRRRQIRKCKDMARGEERILSKEEKGEIEFKSTKEK